MLNRLLIWCILALSMQCLRGQSPCSSDTLFEGDHNCDTLQSPTLACWPYPCAVQVSHTWEIVDTFTGVLAIYTYANPMPTVNIQVFIGCDSMMLDTCAIIGDAGFMPFLLSAHFPANSQIVLSGPSGYAACAFLNRQPSADTITFTNILCDTDTLCATGITQPMPQPSSTYIEWPSLKQVDRLEPNQFYIRRKSFYR